jgi:hypothetical protein
MDRNEILKIMDKIKPLITNDDDKILKIHYYGEGDSFEEWYLESKHENYGKINKIINQLIYDLIDDSDADFNNDGSFGHILIDVLNNKISNQVTHNIMSTEDGDFIEIDLNEDE